LALCKKAPKGGNIKSIGIVRNRRDKLSPTQNGKKRLYKMLRHGKAWKKSRQAGSRTKWTQRFKASDLRSMLDIR